MVAADVFPALETALDEADIRPSEKQKIADEYIPATEGELNDGNDQHRGWYEADAVEAALEMMVEDWGEEQGRQHYAARRWLDGELPPEESEEESATGTEN